jgi:hypothetical protein
MMYKENEMNFSLDRQEEGPISSQLFIQKILLAVQCWKLSSLAGKLAVMSYS